MPKFSVTVAYSVQCYADLEIEALDLNDAIDQIKKDEDGFFENCLAEYDTADDHRIVEIIDENNETVAEAIYINP